MKKYLSIVVGVALLVPSFASALSCMSPDMMIDNYVESSDYVIFTATAGETKEHVKRAADPSGQNPNFQFDEGMTGQFVEVTSLHKGQVSGGLWVYFQKNSTWGYMCSSGPGEVGEDRVYIITPPNGMFDVPQVVDSYLADSDLATDLVSKLEAARDNGPAYINFTTSETWQSDLPNQIREMIYRIRIKLAEWRWWRERA